MGDDDICQTASPSSLRSGCVCRSIHFLVILAAIIPAELRSQARQPVSPAAPLPKTPLPVVKHQDTTPCRVIPKSQSAGKAMSATGASFLAASAGFPPIEIQAEAAATGEPISPGMPQELPPCPPPPLINFFQRFLNGPEVKPLTPREKARLAARNLLDPFNAVTIGATAAISVGSDPHSAYGPGIPGFARYVGISYSQDTTSEFFGTFLIPSVFHADPHYHRMPQAPIPRRILNAIAQVGWIKSDRGNGMPNFSSILGAPIDAELADLYVPGIQTDLPATASRVLIGLGLAPTDNFVTEFLPDIAKRIHVRIVLIQQIINQVARTGPPGSEP